MPKIPAVYIVGGGLAFVALYFITREGFAKSAAKAVAGVVNDVAGGLVEEVSKTVGIPETNNATCTIDLANGDYFKASLSCPAGRLTKYVVTGDDFEVAQQKFINSGA